MDKTMMDEADSRTIWHDSALWVKYLDLLWPVIGKKRLIGVIQLGLTIRVVANIIIGSLIWGYVSIDAGFFCWSGHSSAVVLQTGYEQSWLSSSGRQTGWRPCAANGYFCEQLHFTLIAAGTGCDVGAGELQHHLLKRGWDFSQSSGQFQQAADDFQVGHSAAVGQKAIMPDSDKSPGQAVEQKPSDKFHRSDGDRFGAVFFSVFGAKGHLH